MDFPEHLFSGHMEYTPKIIDNVNWPTHFHHNMEIIYVIKGSVNCGINGDVIELQQGEFALFLSNELHSYDTPKSSLAFVVVFAPDHIPYFTNLTKGMSADHIQFRCEEPLLSYIKQVFITEEPLNTFQIKSCLYGIANQFLKQVTLHERMGTDPGAFYLSVINYLSNNYQYPITLSNMAADLSFNYSYLSRNFNKVFQCNFSELVNLYRIAHAMEMLTNSSSKITDIAFASGFQNIRSFNNAFLKRTGMSPKEFRKNKSSVERK